MLWSFHSHVWMWELDRKEGWEPKNWSFWTVVIGSPLDCKDIKSVNPKGNQPWIFTGRTDAKAEVAILWPPDVKYLLTGKDIDVVKDWGQEEKEVTKDEMVGWHHWLCGREFEQLWEKWRTWKPGVLQSVRSQRVRQDWMNNNRHNWASGPLSHHTRTDLNHYCWWFESKFHKKTPAWSY